MEYYYHQKILPLYTSIGFDVIHYPIQDFGVPDLDSFIAFQRRLIKITESKRILIHCRGGIGRTGLVTAGLFVTLGIHPLRAIQMVRSKRPGSVETEEQEEFLFQYDKTIKGKTR
jgi:atypical dual specificity phosphatase